MKTEHLGRQPFCVTAASVNAYLTAVNENFDGDAPDRDVPLLYSSVWIQAITWETVRRVVPLGEDTVAIHSGFSVRSFARPKIGSRVSSVGRVAQILPRRRSVLITVEIVSEDSDDRQLLSTCRSSIYLRDVPDTPQRLVDRTHEASASANRHAPRRIGSVEEAIDPDQSLRYAAATGDFNHVHVNRGAALAAGFNDVILHGLCTLAFAHRAIVQLTCDGDAARLVSMGAQFGRPTRNGSKIRTDVARARSGGVLTALQFRSETEDGVVLRRGFAEVQKDAS